MKYGIVAILIVLAVALLVPFAFIWAWNILFGSMLEIDYTWKTWISVLILYAFFNGKVAIEKK